MFDNINSSFCVLNPCLTFKEISVFEENNNIVLPEQYKYFLTHIGNGIKFSNNDVIKGISVSNKKLKNRLAYRFLFKEEINTYKGLKPKPYPKYNGCFPQYEDCLSTESSYDLCNECHHRYECISTEFEENDLNDPEDTAYFNGCYEISNHCHYLIISGDSKGQVWHAPEADSGVMIPKYNSFIDFFNAMSK